MTSLAPAAVRTRVKLPLRFADGFAVTATAITFTGLVDAGDHIALGLGQPGGGTPLVRVHSECLTGDVFGSERCDCGPQLREAVERVARRGGYVLYLRQEGRGIGLAAKIDAYALQDGGLDTYQANRALGHGADERDYSVAVQMLRALSVDRVALLTNNPDKVDQLRRLGVGVVTQVATRVHLSPANRRYLAAKARYGAHTFRIEPDVADEALAT
jgi:GTP cyclohydrolase II